ncbi:MAG: hypothetical protein ACRBBN_11150 [Methyloligellaceae bacterium]
MSKIKALTTPSPSLLTSLVRKLNADFLTNWRLVLLGLTGLILSLASGWTTYDGIYNFTKAPVLALMITFGIQGVMLVTAWLIGESFATGATGEDHRESGSLATIADIMRKSGQLFLSIVVLMLIAFILAKFALDINTTDMLQALSLSLFNATSLLGAILFFALFLVLFSKADIIGPYARGVRVILAHLPIWLMFLACMATSVFFSFDSLFTTIFPAEERTRAGDLRAQGQITGIIADLDARLDQRRKDAAQTLLTGKPWNDYNQELNELATLLRSAPKALEAEFNRKLRERQLLFSEQQQIIATAQSSARSLEAERDLLKPSLERLEAREAELEAEVNTIRNEKRAKEQELATRQAEAKAEATGVGETGRAGRGPKFRELNKVVTKLNIEIEAINTRLQTAENALQANIRQRTRGRNRLKEIETQLASFQTQSQAANENLKARQDNLTTGSGLQIDVASGLKSLEKNVASFRQAPDRATLNNLQLLCGRLIATINQVPGLRQRATDIECNPDKTNEEAAKVFTLQESRKRYQTLCGKEAKIPDNTDALLDFGRRCILTSGLPGNDTQQFRNALNRIALNRDDKAHRFVVTWNAFNDGNSLAYLALTIAVAIDALVFMSGLFGANAVVSPLADSPKARNRPVSQLKEIIENALMPDKAYAAALVLNVMSPRSDEDKTGYMASVDLTGLESNQLLLIKNVLSAGASLGLVKHDENNPNLFLVRSELFEFVSSIRAYEAKLGNVRSEAAIPKYVKAGLRPTDPIPLQVESDTTASQKDVQIEFDETKALSRPNPQIEFQPKQVERKKILSSYLRALGITETIVTRLEEMNVSDDPGEWKQRLNAACHASPVLAGHVSKLQESNLKVIEDTQDRLKKTYASSKELLEYVDDYAGTLKNHIPGITLWRAYEQTKKRAHAAREELKAANIKLLSASEEQQREINDIISKLEEAEQNKIDGWLELEEMTEKLKVALAKL